MCACIDVQWNLSKDAPSKGHLSNEDTVCCTKHTELCMDRGGGHLSIQDSQLVPTVSSIERFHCIQDSQLVPMVSTIERFHCIQDSQLGPNGVHYREVPLYVRLCGCVHT